MYEWLIIWTGQNEFDTFTGSLAEAIRHTKNNNRYCDYGHKGAELVPCVGPEAVIKYDGEVVLREAGIRNQLGDQRRLARLEVAPSILDDILRGERLRFAGMPVDAKLVGSFFDDGRKLLNLVYESPVFGRVAEYEPIPQLAVVVSAE